MPRNPFGWDLPPGCTNADVDRAVGPDKGECESCDGEGKIMESECCGANFYPPGYPDNDICSKCGEHSQPYKCEDCNGTGRIDNK